MAARHWRALSIVVCAALAATGAQAAAKKKAKAVAKAPIARGCTYVQAPFCLGLTTSKKTIYSLWNGNPWIPPGTGVEVWGTATGIGPCGVTSIRVTSWKANKNIKCKG